MNKRWSGISSVGKHCLVVASALSISAQAMPLTPVWASSSAKTMQIPVIEEKLDDSGNTPTDVKINEEKAKADLTPLTLTSPAKPVGGASDTTAASADSTAATDTASSGSATSGSGEMLKSTVSETDFVPKGLTDKGISTTPPISIRDASSGDLDAKLIKDAHSTNVLPLALMESRDEMDKKMESRFAAEKSQLTDLWNATLTRSPDIQFVTQRLLPTNKPGHTSAILMRGLQAVMYGAVGAAAMVSPNMGTMMTANMGASMISQVLGGAQANAAKKARLSESETIQLYGMVRGTADKLVDHYRNYRKEMTNLRLAEADLTALQTMVRETRSTQSPSTAIEMEYTLRKAQREINGITEDVRKYRQNLNDLAGGDAVAKLDKQLDEEQLAMDPAIEEAQKEGQLGGPITPLSVAAKSSDDGTTSADLSANDPNAAPLTAEGKEKAAATDFVKALVEAKAEASKEAKKSRKRNDSAAHKDATTKADAKGSGKSKDKDGTVVADSGIPSSKQ